MNRRLVAALACRVGGTRLYGKPLQRLTEDTRILDQIVAGIRSFPQIESIVLGISEEEENLTFMRIAHELHCDYILGHPEDVLSRLIACGRVAAATDVFRVTTDCPFFHYSMFDEAWRCHVTRGNDITVLDHTPLGLGFEIYTLAALERSHAEGLPEDRSDRCSDYARFNQALFQLDILEPSPACRRPDLRLTVDHPEDLIVCRAVYDALSAAAPRIPLERIVEFLDDRPDLKALVEPYVLRAPMWAGQPQRQHRAQRSG